MNELLAAANMLQIDLVSAVCYEYFASELHQSNALDILLFIQMHAQGELARETQNCRCTYLLQGTSMDWKFQTVPQQFSSSGLTNRQQRIPRGKGLGGSSQMHFMLRYSGQEQDFDEWTSLGASEWSYAKIQPFLRHQCSSITPLASPASCPALNLEELPPIPDKVPQKILGSSLLSAGRELNQHSNISNYHFRLSEYDIRRGLRHSAYHEYLRPSFTRRNLHIFTHALVRRLLFDDSLRATGVLVERDGHRFRIRARHEVLLAAGAFHSPQLLKLSGIGPCHELRRMRIPCRVDSARVGANLADHLNAQVFVSINVSASITLDKVFSLAEIRRYLRDGGGVLSDPGIVGTVTAPDGTFGVMLFGVGSTDEAHFRDVSNTSPEMFNAVFPLHRNRSQEGFVLLNWLLRPRSRGVVELSSDGDGIAIDPRYLSEEADVRYLKQAIRLAAKLMATEAFRAIGATIHWPKLVQCDDPGDVPAGETPSDMWMECYVRVCALHGYHPSSTCAIGDVVDQELRVKGVKGLRVVDASVMPSPVAGTPNAVIEAIAKRAAEFIVSDYVQ